MERTVALCSSRSRAAEAMTASALKTWAQSAKALLEVRTTAPPVTSAWVLIASGEAERSGDAVRWVGARG